MRVYVAGALDDVERVREVQTALVAAGHEIVLDWTRASDAEVRDYAARPADAARVARDDLAAVATSDAFVLVEGGSPGRGMYVELGAALLRAERGDLDHVVVAFASGAESVFLHHPAVTRCASLGELLGALG